MQKSDHWIIVADVHAGDIPGALPARENDIYQAWQGLCHQGAADSNCRGIIGVGDLRDKPGIQARNLDGFNAGIRILHEAGKSLLALVGNHDMTDPLWVTAMHHPALHDLADPEVRLAHGMDPQKVLAVHYKNRKDLQEWFESLGQSQRANARTVFLHLALSELSAPNQKCETNMEELQILGFGSQEETLFLLGDIHNYGDITEGKLTAVYPGSIEMTDRNEGVNGLKSNIHPPEKPDFRKFALRWWPEGKSGNGAPEWERFELNCRPWHYVRVPEAKNKNLKAHLELAKRAVEKWTPENPGVLNLILPKKEIPAAKELFAPEAKAGKMLVFNLEAFSKEIHGSDEEEEEPKRGPSNWNETKALLPEMAEEAKLSPRAISLLKKLIEADGSTHNPKNDVGQAWDKWIAESNPTAPISPEGQTDLVLTETPQETQASTSLH